MEYLQGKSWKKAILGELSPPSQIPEVMGAVVSLRKTGRCPSTHCACPPWSPLCCFLHHNSLLRQLLCQARLTSVFLPRAGQEYYTQENAAISGHCLPFLTGVSATAGPVFLEDGLARTKENNNDRPLSTHARMFTRLVLAVSPALLTTGFRSDGSVHEQLAPTRCRHQSTGHTHTHKRLLNHLA